MNRLALLYAEVEGCLERGETSSPQLDRLFGEISQLQAGEDMWFNFDPKGIARFSRTNSNEVARREAAPPSSVG